MSASQIEDQPVMLLESAAVAARNLGDSEASSSANSQTTIHRGMAVQTSEGNTAGHVAAVVLDQEQQEVSHILLVQECQLLQYRLIPVELIQQIGDEKVLLRILQPTIDALPVWHST